MCTVMPPGLITVLYKEVDESMCADWLVFIKTIPETWWCEIKILSNKSAYNHSIL